MNEIKWESTVSAIGPEAALFIEENVLVLFDTSAPEELREFAVIHPPAELHAPVSVGDLLYLGETSFRVTAVGEVANNNLASLGHLVVKANGNAEVEMPGDVCVEASPLPAISEGMVMRVVAAEEGTS